MNKFLFRGYLGLVFTQALAALIYMWWGDPLFLDIFLTFTMAYRGAVILFISFVSSLLITSGILLVLSLKKDAVIQRVLRFLKVQGEKHRKLFLYCGGMMVVGLLSAQFLSQSGSAPMAIQRDLIKLLTPNLLFILLVSLESVFILIYLSGNFDLFRRPLAFRFFIVFGVFLLLWIGISFTDFGFHKTNNLLGHFRLPGHPLLGYQVFIVWLGTFVVFLFTRGLWNQWNRKTSAPAWVIDGGISLLLMLMAYLAWHGVPVKSNAFIDIPRPPNYEQYPALDAIIYDRTAQNLLATGDFESYVTTEGHYLSHVGRRPLLSLYLAVLHSIFGLGYMDVVPVQVLIFALLPVVVYLFTSALANRPAGLLTALLIIIRQRNGILLGNAFSSSNLHMLMSDIPTTIGVIFFLYLAVCWFRGPRDKYILPLLMGGVIGGTILIRVETVVIMLVTAVLALILMWKEPKEYLRSMTPLIFGMLVVISPWIARNWHKTGRVYIDKPDNFMHVVRSINLIFDYQSDAYQQSGKEKLSQFESYQENIPFFVSQQSFDKGGVLLKRPLEKPVREEASNADNNVITTEDQTPPIALIANHYVNGLLESILYLPNTPLMLDIDYISKGINLELGRVYGGMFYSLDEYTRRVPYWRMTWNGRLASESVMLICIFLLLIALGISRTWIKQGILVFLPIGAFLTYILIFAFIQRSGGRYLMPVDWMTSMFACVGLIELISWGMKGHLVNHRWVKEEQRSGLFEYLSAKKSSFIFFCVTLLLLGSTPVMVERILPNKYPRESMMEKVDFLLNNPLSPLSNKEQELISSFMDNGGQSLFGRALYPRFFEPGKEVIDTIEIYYEDSTTFYLSGTEFEYIVLPEGEAPDFFPHRSDVLVFGCPPLPKSFEWENQVCLHCFDEKFDALAVVLYSLEGDEIQKVLWRQGNLEVFTGCPLPSLGQ